MLSGCAGLDFSDAEPPTPTYTAQTIPLIDAHNHVMEGLTPEMLISALDQAGVSRVILMSWAAVADFEQKDKFTLDMLARLPERVIPFLSTMRLVAYTRAFLNYVDRQLATGKFKGIGEVMVLHYAFSLTARDGTVMKARDVNTPADSPFVLDLMCLAAKHNVVLTMHMETTAETVAALDRALAQNPDTKVIWAHQTHLKTLGESTPENARKADPQQIAVLMDKYPNLYADIATGLEREYLMKGDGRLPAAWRNLYEKYSSRFVVGIDQPFLVGWQTGTYERWAKLGRTWLSQLSSSSQRSLAFENIERILASKPSTRTTCQFRTP